MLNRRNLVVGGVGASLGAPELPRPVEGARFAVIPSARLAQMIPPLGLVAVDEFGRLRVGDGATPGGLVGLNLADLNPALLPPVFADWRSAQPSAQAERMIVQGRPYLRAQGPGEWWSAQDQTGGWWRLEGGAPPTLRDFGARGDGVADDTEAIRAAFAAAPPGAQLDGGGGRYRISAQINIPVGSGGLRAAVIDGSAVTEPYLLFAGPATDPFESGQRLAAPAEVGAYKIRFADMSGVAPGDVFLLTHQRSFAPRVAKDQKTTEYVEVDRVVDGEAILRWGLVFPAEATTAARRFRRDLAHVGLAFEDLELIGRGVESEQSGLGLRGCVEPRLRRVFARRTGIAGVRLMQSLRPHLREIRGEDCARPGFGYAAAFGGCLDFDAAEIVGANTRHVATVGSINGVLGHGGRCGAVYGVASRDALFDVHPGAFLIRQYGGVLGSIAEVLGAGDGVMIQGLDCSVGDVRVTGPEMRTGVALQPASAERPGRYEIGMVNCSGAKFAVALDDVLGGAVESLSVADIRGVYKTNALLLETGGGVGHVSVGGADATAIEGPAVLAIGRETGALRRLSLSGAWRTANADPKSSVATVALLFGARTGPERVRLALSNAELRGGRWNLRLIGPVDGASDAVTMTSGFAENQISLAQGASWNGQSGRDPGRGRERR